LTSARGAHGSKGRTSWSGRPELDDYISFAACFMHYLCYLEPQPYSETDRTLDLSPLKLQAPKPANLPCEQVSDSPIVVLGGYSYGSYILRHLPPITTILQTFTAPQAGSAAEEVLLRARKLSAQTNMDRITLVRHQEQEGRTTKEKNETKTCVTMGGEETSPELRRASKDIRRSHDLGSRAGVGNKFRSLSHRQCEADCAVTPPKEHEESTLSSMPQVQYLLISPLMPPISTLAAPALGRRFWSKGTAGCHEAIGKYPTLAIYGDHDAFSSARKLREWTSQFQAAPNSLFSSVEISGAGHFWFEPGVEEQLRVTLRKWEAEVR
jgi:alpha/beta superfamily hydrolase